MKKIDELREHFATTSYSKRDREAIRYWLMGRGIDIDESVINQPAAVVANRQNFDYFKNWYEYEDDYLSRICNNILERFTTASLVHESFVEHDEAYNKASSHKIEVGDYVKVHDLDNPRTEYVEAIANYDKKHLYCLSDGTWVDECCVSRFKVQGDERKALIDKLNEIESSLWHYPLKN